MSEFPSRLRSDFEILCERDGLAEIGAPVHHDSLHAASNKLPFHATWEAYRQWAPDERIAKSYWPWVAFAANHYAFEREEKAAYTDESKPSELRATVQKIGADAKRLYDGIARLRALANRLDEIDHPYRRGHIAYLYELISHNGYLGTLIGRDAPTMVLTAPSESAPVMIEADVTMRRLLRQLLWIEFGAIRAEQTMEAKLIRRTRPQEDKGLAGLVALAASIWEHMTDRKPSTSQVFDTALAEHVAPPFVIFVQGIAGLVGVSPTLAAIETAAEHCQAS